VIAAILSLILGLPSLSAKDLSVDGVWHVACGYIAHPDDDQDSWSVTTRDHCRVLQQEAIDVWWQDTIIEMKDRGEIP
jgi:hypothetical protein